MKDATSILSHFGLVVKELRRKKQLSQEELANRCGLHRTYITDIEHGTRNVSLKNISKIARAVEESLHNVFAYVEQYAQQGAHSSGLVAQQSKNRQTAVEILLIEDDQRFVDQMVEELHRAKIGNKVHVVRSGEEAIKLLFPAKTDDNKFTRFPNVILLDLQLPSISALEVLERIRKDKNTKDIPVVIVNSSTTNAEKERWQRLGIEEYLTKPLNIDNFTAAMRRLGFLSLYIERDLVQRD